MSPEPSNVGRYPPGWSLTSYHHVMDKTASQSQAAEVQLQGHVISRNRQAVVIF